jgi:hypothetical protein
MGYDLITGPELVKKFKDQLIWSYYVDHFITEVEKIEPTSQGFSKTTSDFHN